MNELNGDTGIPLLTEVIEPMRAALSANEARSAAVPLMPPKAVPQFTPPALQSVMATAAVPASERIEDEWSRLERKVSARVLQQLIGRVDRALDQRIRDSIASVLQPVVDGLAGEIRQGLQHALEDLISRAVAQEINRLHPPKK